MRTGGADSAHSGALSPVRGGWDVLRPRGSLKRKNEVNGEFTPIVYEEKTMDKNMQEFSTAQIITITTGVLFCNMDGVYEILDFMSGDSNFTHQLPRVSRECEPYLREEFEWLAHADEIVEEYRQRPGGMKKHYPNALAQIETLYGERHKIRRIHAEDHDVIDPIEEIKRMNPNSNVIKLNSDDDVTPPSVGDLTWKN